MKHLVRQIEVCQMRQATTVMSVVTDQHQERALKPLLFLEFLNDATDQAIGLGNRTARHTELTAT